MELVMIYTGPSIEARMLHETLADRGVRSILRAAEPMRGIIGDAALPMFEHVLVADIDLEARRDVIEECLDFVRHSGELFDDELPDGDAP
jgi:hypothetical protein